MDDLHITDRTLYNHLRGEPALTPDQFSHLATCTKCTELMKVITNLKEYIDIAEAKKNDARA